MIESGQQWHGIYSLVLFLGYDLTSIIDICFHETFSTLKGRTRKDFWVKSLSGFNCQKFW
jgi:hypothetical protein